MVQSKQPKSTRKDQIRLHYTPMNARSYGFFTGITLNVNCISLDYYYLLQKA